MSAKWAQFEEQKSLYPNLRYVAVMDGRTRDQHARWHNTILPIDDPWWDTHLPPNDWGCRCNVVQTDAEATVPPTAEAKENFSNNPGKTGKAFVNSGYEKRLTPNERKQAEELGDALFKRVVNKETFNKLIADKNYFDVVFNDISGGVKATHKDHKFDKVRGHYEKEVQDILHLQGRKIILEPEIRVTKNIEGFLDNIPVEIKSIIGNSHVTIKKRIAESVAKGADCCILYFPKKSDPNLLQEAIKTYRGKLPKLVVIHDRKIIRDDTK